MKAAIVALAGTLLAMPALAQPQPKGPPAGAPAADQAAMHEKCRAMMGARMAGQPPHEHSRDKQGIAAAKGKPPTAAEMEAMHKHCAELMAKSEAAPKK